MSADIFGVIVFSWWEILWHMWTNRCPSVTADPWEHEAAASKCPGDWLVKIQITVCVMSIIQIKAIFKMVKERPRWDDLGPGEWRGRGNHKSCSSRWEITNTNLTLEWALTLCTYFALTLPFKPSIKSLSIAHSTDNFKHEQQKGLCFCVCVHSALKLYLPLSEC